MVNATNKEVEVAEDLDLVIILVGKIIVVLTQAIIAGIVVKGDMLSYGNYLLNIAAVH